jgi:hypothetical protein
MRYRCLVFHEEKKLDALPENERCAFEHAHLDHDERSKRAVPSWLPRPWNWFVQPCPSQ